MVDVLQSRSIWGDYYDRPSTSDIRVKTDETFGFSDFISYNPLNKAAVSEPIFDSNGAIADDNWVVYGFDHAFTVDTLIGALDIPVEFLDESYYSATQMEFFNENGIVFLVGGNQIPNNAEFTDVGTPVSLSNSIPFEIPEGSRNRDPLWNDLIGMDELRFNLTKEEFQSFGIADAATKNFDVTLFSGEAIFQSFEFVPQYDSNGDYTGDRIVSTYQPEDAFLHYDLMLPTTAHPSPVELGRHSTIQVEFVNSLPEMQVSQTFLKPSETVTFSNIANYFDEDGDEALTFEFETLNGEHVAKVNGFLQSDFTYDDLGAVILQGTTTGGVTNLRVRANDGYDWGQWETFSVITHPVDDITPPEEVVFNVDTQLGLARLLNIPEDQWQYIDGVTIRDTEGESNFAVNGRVIDARTAQVIGDISTVTVVGGAQTGTSHIEVNVNAGGPRGWAGIDLTVLPADAPNIIRGTDQRDELIGTFRTDHIFGLADDDTLIGGSGNDSLAGEDGNDLLIGGSSTDLSSTSGAQVYRIYQATLDRVPDTGGFEFWTGELETGSRSLLQVVAGFTNSGEFQNTYGSLNNTGFVTLLYNNVLERTPDAGGLNAWVGALNNGTSRAQVVTGFSESGEFQNNTSIEASAYAEALDGRAESAVYDDVYRLYQATLDRAPDAAGLEGWSEQLAVGREYTSVAGGFTNSGEFRNIYGNLSDSDFVDQLYRNVLDREADAGGRQGWLNVINGGGSREDVVQGFAQSGEFVGNTASDFRAYMKATGGDTLDGGVGDDTLYGGTGADTFIFDASEDGSDTVLQLDPWDTLQFEGFGYSSATDARAQMSAVGPDVRFADQGVTITFAGADLATMQEVDYLFE